MTQDNIIEIPVKAILTGEFNNFDSWIKNTQALAHQYGFLAKLLHQDKNGFATSGYDLKNHQHTYQEDGMTQLMFMAATVELIENNGGC